MSVKDFKQRFREIAESCGSQSKGLIVHHRTGSAVVRHVNDASIETDWMRVRFQPHMGALRRLGLTVWRFFSGKVSFRHLFVIDTTIPESGPKSGLDRIVRQLGFQMNAEREVRGSRSQILLRLVLSLVAALPVPLLQLLPRIRAHPLFHESELLHWLEANWQYPLIGGIFAVPLLFLYFEWRANLLGLFRPKSVLSNVDEEVAFIANEIKRRQRRSGLWLFIELPLVYLLVVPLLVMHVLVLFGRIGRALHGIRKRDRQIGRRISTGPLMEHVAWIIADLFIVAVFVAGCCLRWDDAGQLQLQQPTAAGFWTGGFLSFTAFLAIATLRELGKLIGRKPLAWNATGLKLLLAFQGLAVLFLLGLAAWPWLDPSTAWPSYIQHITSPGVVVLALFLIALLRRETQSPRWVLMRICEVQRLGPDFEPLFKQLCEIIKKRLLIVGLWNTDERPGTPTGFEELQAPQLHREQIFAELSKLFSRNRRGTVPKRTLADLTDYMIDLTRGLDDPFRSFVRRMRQVISTSNRLRDMLYEILPVIASDRKEKCCWQSDELRPAQEERVGRTISWERDVRNMERLSLEKWKEANHVRISKRSEKARQKAIAKAQRLICRIVSELAEWEADTRRFHLRVLGNSKASEFPTYVDCLVRLAQFVALNAEEALYFEDQREDAREAQARSFPSLGVPVSLCHGAGLFGEIALNRVRHLIDDYLRQGFLVSSDPIIFDDAWLAFLSTGYLTVPALYAQHEYIVSQLAAAGQRDHRFYKVAAEWAYNIQTPRYWGQLRGQDWQTADEMTDDDRVIAQDSAVDLAYRSASLLLQYYETVSRDGIPGVDPEQLYEELETLSRRPSDTDSGAVSIPARLTELQQRMSGDSAPLADQLWEKWRRIQIRRFLLRGDFNIDGASSSDAALGSSTKPTLHDLLHYRSPTDSAEKDYMHLLRYDPVETHNCYYLGNIAFERGDLLTALTYLTKAGHRAYRKDDVLYAKINYYAAQCLMSMGHYAWADAILEHLYESFGVYLSDDPFFLLLKLQMAKVDSYCWSRTPLITSKVETRYLEPLRQQSSRPDFPKHIKAELKLTEAVYCEKSNSAPTTTKHEVCDAYVILQDMPTRTWQRDLTILHLARASRRCATFSQMPQMLSESLSDFVGRMRRTSRSAYIDICHTLAREHTMKGELIHAKTFWLHVITASLADEGSQQLRTRCEEQPPTELSDVLDTLKNCVPRPGHYVYWDKALHAVRGLLDVFKEESERHDVRQLNDDACVQIRNCWIEAYRWLHKSFAAFCTFHHKAAEVKAFKPDRLASGTANLAGVFFLRPFEENRIPRLGDFYCRMDQNEVKTAVLAEPLARLKEQMLHLRASLHLRLTFLLPIIPDASPDDDAPLLGRKGERQALTRAFPADGYLDAFERTLEGYGITKWSSSAIRDACEWCRMYVFMCLLQGPVARGLLNKMRTSSRKWIQRLLRQNVLPLPMKLMLYWNTIGSRNRLRMVVDGMVSQLKNGSQHLIVPGAQTEMRQLEALASRLASGDFGTPSSVKAAEHEFFRIVLEFQHEIDNHLNTAAAYRTRPRVAADTELRFQVFPAKTRATVRRVIACYENALAVLVGHPENDIYESVLNRITVLEALRDAVWFLSEQKRALLEALRSRQEEVERLFFDLERINNPWLTTRVRESFYPAWADVHTALKEIQDNLERLSESLVERGAAG